MKKIFIAFLSAILFNACTKDNLSDTKQESHIAAKDPATWNTTVANVALDVSTKLKASKAFRKMLKHEALLRFDGDANILLSSIVAHLPKYIAWENQNTPNSTDKISKLNFSVITNAAAIFPQMQLSVQTEAELWNADTQIPSVVYVGADYNEGVTNTVKGYNASQASITVSTTIEPTVNFVVVSLNERTKIDADGRLLSTNYDCLVSTFNDNAPYNQTTSPVYANDNCWGQGGGSGSSGGTGGTIYNQYVGIGQDGTLPTLLNRYYGTIIKYYGCLLYTSPSPRD